MSTIATTTDDRATLETYIQAEESTGERHEYRDGKLVLMVGGSQRHSLITGNVFFALRPLAISKSCQAHVADMRVLSLASNTFTYPDVVVSDGAPEFTAPTDTLTNPLLIAEVLSQSTEAYDRGEKFEQYCQISSFKEYLLISQDKVSVTHFVRQPDNNWLRMSYQKLDDEISLQSIGGKLSVSDIYLQVSFSDETKAK